MFVGLFDWVPCFCWWTSLCVAVVYQVLSKVEMTEEAQDLQRGMELADEALEEQATALDVGGSVRLSMLG